MLALWWVGLLGSIIYYHHGQYHFGRIYLEPYFQNVNHWVWVIGLTAFMTVVNLRGARFVANFNSLIVLVQLVSFCTLFI
jgi:amino acid transporter